MNTYRIIKRSAFWSTNTLTREVEEVLEYEEDAGWTVVSVAFGINIWMMPTAFITLRRS